MAASATPRDAIGGLPPVSDAEFRTFQKLIYDEAGIHLNATKRALLAGRLSRRLRELSLASLEEYHAYVVAHSEERVQLLDRITTNETRFFREPGQFELIEKRLVPEWQAASASGRRPRRIRAWSAACSSGEEPYSLAMVLLAHCPPEQGWEIEIVASDVSTRVLERARAAVWTAERAADVPESYRRGYMLRGIRSQENHVKAAPELRERIQFVHLNLMAERYPFAEPFDLVFCRNVLIYFDGSSKAHVMARLIGQLVPGGHLFLGHSETLARTQPEMSPVAPNVYRRAAAGERCA